MDPSERGDWMSADLEGNGHGWTNRRRGALAFAAALVATCAFAVSAGAATYTPTTFADDSPSNPGDCPENATAAGCSLREAIDAATSTPADDVVTLAAGTYTLDPTLEPGRIAIFADGPGSGALVIRGAGARTTIVDAGADDQHPAFAFEFRQIDADVEDLAITGGNYNGRGGAIQVHGSDSIEDADVTLTRVRVHGNAANSGGAISNDGKLTVVQSLIDGNSAASHGGGIQNDDELTIVNSTISGNEAGGDGGGVFNSGQAAEQQDQFFRADSSTIAFNKAAGNGGGIATPLDFCEIYPSHCEGSFRLAAEQPLSVARFHNSIVSDNTANGGTNCSGNQPAGSGESTSSEGHNLEDGDSCLFTAEGDRDQASGLVALADNGGGTNTHKLNDGSAAIDAGDSADCPAADQRGTTRPQRSGCDIGAFEREADPAPVQEQQTQQQLPPQQTPEARGPRCLDTQPPVTTMDRDGLRVSPTTVTLSGIARDRGQPCASGVQRIEVSMAKVSGADLNCRFIRRSNRFVLSPFQNCRQPIRFVADGTSQWQFRFRVKLKPGKYRAQARGYDQERNKETPKKHQNIVTFTVR